MLYETFTADAVASSHVGATTAGEKPILDRFVWQSSRDDGGGVVDPALVPRDVGGVGPDRWE